MRPLGTCSSAARRTTKTRGAETTTPVNSSKIRTSVHSSNTARPTSFAPADREVPAERRTKASPPQQLSPSFTSPPRILTRINGSGKA